MDSTSGFSDADKLLWKKIKRNGNFSKRKKELLKNICQDTTRSADNAIPMFSYTQPTNVVSQTEPVLIFSENEKFTNQRDTLNENIESDDSEDESGGSFLKPDAHEFCNEIRKWAVENQIKHSAINGLLLILKSHIPDNVLLKCARTLLQTPRCTEISTDDRLGGQYWHYGLNKVLVESLSNINNVPESLSINVNIDGLPAFKSSSTSFWPILVNIHELREIQSPLTVGIFCGASNIDLLV